MKSLQLAFSFQEGTWFGVLVGDRDKLVASAFADDKRSVEKYLAEISEKTRTGTCRETNHRYVEEMARLYNGHQPSRQVELELETVTNFQGRVYSVLNRIPRGRVTNYGLIAKAIHSGPRAVGQAVGSNPCPLFVPCHRVVPADMTVGNYSMAKTDGQGRSDVKKALLEREGIRFQREKIPPGALWTPVRASS